MRNCNKTLLLIFYNIIFSCSIIWSQQQEANNQLVEKPFVVIVPSYKNINWYEKNINSILSQEYHNYRIIYLNDASSDKMQEKIEQYLRKKNVDFHTVTFDDSFSRDIVTITDAFKQLVNEEHHFFTLIHNINRCGALANIYRAVQSCDDDEIIVLVDGDDWLYNNEILNLINQTYISKNIWLTHGTLIHYPGNYLCWSEPIPHNIIASNTFRTFKCPSHLRTFYAWLFKKIKLEDLLYLDNFFSMTSDMAIMYPMIEMCGDRHEFIERITYTYNIANELNDNKIDPNLQMKLDQYIRNMRPYDRLDDI